MPLPPKNTRTFEALVKVVEDLRGPEGCPWDKEQTHSSLTPYALEEAHELVEAIDRQNWPQVQEELGDVLLQVVLHAEVARQDGRFDIYDVIQTLCEKMIRRHPHVFADTKVSGSAQVLENWNTIKAQEKSKTARSKSGFDIPVALPALLRSQKIGAKTKKHHFDWSQPAQVMEKVEEELAELKEALAQNRSDRQQEELGDLLFSLAQLARHLNFDAEQALRVTNQRFERRFQLMQELAGKDRRDFAQLTNDELEEYWKKAKQLTKNSSDGDDA